MFNEYIIPTVINEVDILKDNYLGVDHVQIFRSKYCSS